MIWEDCYEPYKNYVNGEFKWITLHTGMKFYVANMQFEVLFTDEDLSAYTYNENYYYFPEDNTGAHRIFQGSNDICVVTKMTDLTSGQKTLWLGDLKQGSAKLVAETYGDYVDCDILQVAHHGMAVNLPLYQKVSPTVALWPTTEGKRVNNDETANGIYKETNHWLDNNVPTNLYANGIYTITLPYETGDPVVEYDYE
jgi:hypothetical protein